MKPKSLRINASDLNTLKVENFKVILEGRLKEWVGTVWTDLGVPTAADRRKYPVVVHE